VSSTLTEPPDAAAACTSDVFSAALRGEPCAVLGLTLRPMTLPIARWADDADESDDALLAHCQGPTIDIGCGPGRMTYALAARGVCALGIDLVAEAVMQARARGASAILRDVFDKVPGEGRWHCALIADGNIGIGGDPERLLRRVAALVSERGRIIVDLAAPGLGLATRVLQLEVSGRRSEPFSWSVLAPEALPAAARGAGLHIREMGEHHGRWFAVLHKDSRR